MEKIQDFFKRFPSLAESQVLTDEMMEKTEGGTCEAGCEPSGKDTCEYGCEAKGKRACKRGCVDGGKKYDCSNSGCAPGGKIQIVTPTDPDTGDESTTTDPDESVTTDPDETDDDATTTKP